MTDDERAAREWLLEAYNDMYTSEEEARHRATILRLLDRPVMPRPEDFPGDAMVEIADANGIPYANFRGMYRDLHAHLTAPPKPKKIERWVIVNSAGELVSAYSTEAEVRERVIGDGCRIVKLVEAADADA